MPLYDFVDNKTGKEFSETMKIAEKEQYLLDNPHIQQIFIGVPPLIDPVRLGIRKIDNGFKEVLQKIKSRAPGSNLNV